MGIQQIQSSAAVGTNTNQLSIILNANCTSCDLLTTAVGWYSSSNIGSPTVSDGVNSWSSVGIADNGNGYKIQLFQAPDISAGSTTVNVNFSNSVDNVLAVVNEWKGTVATSEGLDQVASGFSLAISVPNVGNVVPRQSPELFYDASLLLQNFNPSATGGFRLGSRIVNQSLTLVDEYKEFTGAAKTSQSGDGWALASGQWLGVSASFAEYSYSACPYWSGIDGGGTEKWNSGQPDNNGQPAQFGYGGTQVSDSFNVFFSSSGLPQITGSEVVQGIEVSFVAKNGNNGSSWLTAFNVNGQNFASNNPIGGGTTFSAGGPCSLSGGYPPSVSIQVSGHSTSSSTVNVSGFVLQVYYYTPLPQPPYPTGSVTLYMRGSGPTGIVPLYTHGSQAVEGSLPLYVAGPTAVTSGIPLWLSARLETGMVPLYVGGPTKATGSIPLYITGPRTNLSGMSLFVWGNSPITGSVPLYIAGPTEATGGIPLFITTPIPDSGNFPLYIYGKAKATEGFNLFTLGPTPYKTGVGTSLYTLGSHAGTTGLVHETTLYVGGTGPYAGMNLFLNGAGDYKTSSMMNMFSRGSNKNVSKGATLFISNHTSGISSETPLFVQGAGQGIFSPNGQLGGYPSSGDMNLFLLRWPTAMTTLFLASNFADSGNIPLYLDGTNTLSSGIGMFMAGGRVDASASQKLYTHGF